MKVSPVIQKSSRLFDIPLPDEFVQRRDAEPIRTTRIQSVCEEEFIQRPGLGTHRPGHAKLSNVSV